MVHPLPSSAKQKLLASGSHQSLSHPRSPVATRYDIYYNTHLSWVGWQGWKKNGEVAGDRPGSHIEAVMMKLVEKSN